MTPNLNIQPDIKVSLKQTFGIDSEMEVEAFSKKNEYVPEIDKSYKFDRDTTLAIISGFAHRQFIFKLKTIQIPYKKERNHKIILYYNMYLFQKSNILL